MNNLNFDNEAQELLKVTLINGTLSLLCYILIWFILSKIIKNKKTKAILIGLITPFFFYYSVGHLWYPLGLLLYVLEIDPVGLISGIIFGLLKPLSLVSGILVTLYLIKKK